MAYQEKGENPAIARRDFLRRSRDLGTTALIAGSMGAFGAFFTESLRAGRPERVGLLNPTDVTTAVRALGYQAVDLFLDNGRIRNGSITEPILQNDTQTLIFNSDLKKNNNPAAHIQVTGGYNNQTEYSLAFGLPFATYRRILAAGGDINAAISDNITVLSMSVVGRHGLAVDNEMLLYGKDWTGISTHHEQYTTTDPKKIAHEHYRALTVPDMIQFYSDIQRTLAEFK